MWFAQCQKSNSGKPLCSPCRAGIDDVETDVVEIEAKLDKV